MEETALLARARRGDTGAYGELVRAHELNIRRLATGMLGDADEAEDAAQDAFVKAWRNLRAFRGDAAFGTWVHRIAVNACRDRLRRRSRRPGVSWDALLEFLGGEPASTATPATRTTGRTDARDELQRLLASLPPDHRAILLLREANGMAYDEIAATMGVSLDAVKARLRRARIAAQAAARHFDAPVASNQQEKPR